MMQTPILVADLLDGNSWDSFGEGELNLPESMLNRMLSSLSMPLPIVALELLCQSGFFLIRLKLDLRGQGLPLKPEVEQTFELERVRIDPINKFILLKPVGGLRIREETLGRSRLSPMASALVTTILHTPTLLKLVRDRFPRTVNYDNGRLHINLAGMEGIRESLDREVSLGHVQLRLLEVLSIHNIEIRKGRVVIRFVFEKKELLEKLSIEPPEGFYGPPKPEPGAAPYDDPARLLPPPSNQPPERKRDRAVRGAKMIASFGAGALRKRFRRK